MELRLYQVGNTSSRQTTEVKQFWNGLAMGWVTSSWKVGGQGDRNLVSKICSSKYVDATDSSIVRFLLWNRLRDLTCFSVLPIHGQLEPIYGKFARRCSSISLQTVRKLGKTFR